jgi:antitoxin CcdA
MGMKPSTRPVSIERGTTMPGRNASVAKRATNVSVDSDLLVADREAAVNLFAALERALKEELADSKRKQWQERNRDALAAYNEFIEEHGTSSDGLRSF